MSTANTPPGTPAPEVEHRLFRRHELAEYPAAFAATLHPVLVNVFTQDGANLPMLRQGTQSDSFHGMVLGDQEVRLRHFHQTIERFLSGEIPAELMAKAGTAR